MKALRLFLFSAILGLGGAAYAASEKPNIILIYTDDHGWPDIGAAGIYEDLKTPHIDALAASGVRATNGYSTAPQCVPSRAGLLSGRSQNRFGVESNASTLERFAAQETIAERLKKAGYATGQIGKWHLGPTDKITDHGFDDVYSKNANRPCHANFNLAGETIGMQMVDDGLYHLDACGQAALTFIGRHAGGPFFLYLAYRAPHVPLDAPPRYLERFPGKMPERRRQALAMISAMDDGIGAIVADLEKRGLTEKTLIFLIADNGAPLKIHQHDAPGGGPGWDGSLNQPMNGEKGMLAEGGMRVPFLISWPGTIPDGQVYDQPVWTLDVAATAAALAGQPGGDALDGVNLIPFLNGEKPGVPHDFLAWRWISQAAIREGKWKLLRGGRREYLFDLGADPEEKHDLKAQYPEVLERLRSRLSGWSEQLDPPGLAAGSMSGVWETYFDYYLDGKPAPPIGQTDASPEPAGAVCGWISRNSRIEVKDGALAVTPDESKRSPFIVRSDFQFDAPLTARVVLRTEKGGRAGIAWRREGQRDFAADQAATREIAGADDWQTVEGTIPGGGKVIHLRVLLPKGASVVREVVVTDASGKVLASWDFRE